MKFFKIAGFGVLGLLYADPAFALAILNVDPKPHSISVTAGTDSKKLTIEPGKQTDAPCDGGCKVTLENGEQYELKGSETVSIDGGVIFIDASPDADASDIPNIDPDAPSPDQAAPRP
jgi:hypothetical protein